MFKIEQSYVGLIRWIWYHTCVTDYIKVISFNPVFVATKLQAFVWEMYIMQILRVALCNLFRGLPPCTLFTLIYKSGRGQTLLCRILHFYYRITYHRTKQLTLLAKIFRPFCYSNITRCSFYLPYICTRNKVVSRAMLSPNL